MATLSIDPDYLRRLVVKVRAFMGKEAPELLDEGSNPTDDEMPSSALQEDADDLSREEVVEEIRGLGPRQQAELVALMWLGRDDADGEEFEQLVAQALERREVPTEDYLLDHPPRRRALARGHGAPWSRRSRWRLEGERAA
jgi:hypothetical protein